MPNRKAKRRKMERRKKHLELRQQKRELKRIKKIRREKAFDIVKELERDDDIGGA